VRQVSKRISEFRNLAVHGGVGDELDASIRIDGADWLSKFSAFDRKVEEMCSLLVGFAGELERKGLIRD
jgi:hypothetical protein